MTKSSFLTLILSSLPAPSVILARPGQTEAEAIQARREALAATLDLTYPSEDLPEGLARAYRIASDGQFAALPAHSDRAYGPLKGRSETTGQIADLLPKNEIADLGAIAKFWTERADAIEAQTADLIAAGRAPAQVAATVAALRRESTFLTEFLS